jgi:hypothetical protein
MTDVVFDVFDLDFRRLRLFIRHLPFFLNNPFCLAMGDKDMNICHVLLLCHSFSFINK